MSASSSTCVKEAKKETRKLMKDRLKAVTEQIMKEESEQLRACVLHAAL
jgi:hypothetical protein